MSLQTCLVDLLDLPRSYAFKEANSKLSQTYMFVNKELVFIHNIEETYLEVITKEGSENGGETSMIRADKVESLEPWLPKTGVYTSKSTGEAIFLYRRPVRQWKRSFSHSFYTVSGNTKIWDIDPNSWREFWVAKDKNIMFYDQNIGHIKNSTTYVCTYAPLAQELNDWLRS